VSIAADTPPPIAAWIMLAIVLLALGLVVMWAMEQKPRDDDDDLP
jgi:MFS-type transporter involved in bile tolerance (Atg22 family)